MEPDHIVEVLQKDVTHAPASEGRAVAGSAHQGKRETKGIIHKIQRKHQSFSAKFDEPDDDFAEIYFIYRSCEGFIVECCSRWPTEIFV